MRTAVSKLAQASCRLAHAYFGSETRACVLPSHQSRTRTVKRLAHAYRRAETGACELPSIMTRTRTTV